MDILMPQLGETVNEGTVTIWHKKAGDEIAKGELLLEVETDKVSTEITAPESGVLDAINVDAGETVDVGTVLAVIAAESDAGAKTSAKATSISAGQATWERVTISTGPGLPKKPSGDRLSPVVRRLLRQHNLDVGLIVGTGRDGRITRLDVLNHVDLAGSSGKGLAASEGGVERIPFNRIRKVTADRMVRSKATSAHVLQTIDADFSAVDRVRLAQREPWRTKYGYSLSYLPFVARALCLAIAEFPRVNATVEDNALLIHGAVHLAIAVDLDFEGLVAPVVKNANQLEVSQLATRFNDLANRAKANGLKSDDLQGGTYTLSNPGPFGTLFTAPIINQPQVGILSLDAVKKRPVVIETESGDTIGIRPVGMLAHSFDHRAVDGAYSAAFLQKLKTIIETSEWEAEL